MVSTRRQRSKSRTRSSVKPKEAPPSHEEEVKDKVVDAVDAVDAEIAEENMFAEETMNDQAIPEQRDESENEAPEVMVEKKAEPKPILRIRPRKGGLGLTSKTAQSGKNELSKLIPGYTAEMRLQTPSLSKFRPSGGIDDLIRQAESTDASTRNFVGEATKKHIDAMQRTATGSISAYNAEYASFKKGTKRPKDESAGKGWFNMQPTAMSDELKSDLSVIRNRSYLDPKRFYKSSDKHHKIVQVGTVIEGAAEYYSSRLTKKQRKSNITEEILADKGTSSWATNKFKQMQREKTEKSKQRRRKRGRSKR